MKKIAEIIGARDMHWVGDGFPVRTLFSYDRDPQAVSPFLLFDYAGPHVFEPSERQRGVGLHPHRGFETVTIVYDGEVVHKDSAGGGGVIGPGDVQWMTAASGVLHEELHSPGFAKSGGPFRMVQLWVNLPAKDKMKPPAYQAILSANIPVVDLDGGKARVIAGAFQGARGPARTFTPIEVWDIRLNRDAQTRLDLPEGHNAMIAVLAGRVTVNGAEQAGEAEIVRFDRDGTNISVRAEADSILLVLAGAAIDEPVVGQGPFVMNTTAEIAQAIDDYKSGRFSRAAPEA